MSNMMEAAIFATPFFVLIIGIVVTKIRRTSRKGREEIEQITLNSTERFNEELKKEILKLCIENEVLKGQRDQEIELLKLFVTDYENYRAGKEYNLYALYIKSKAFIAIIEGGEA